MSAALAEECISLGTMCAPIARKKRVFVRFDCPVEWTLRGRSEAATARPHPARNAGIPPREYYLVRCGAVSTRHERSRFRGGARASRICRTSPVEHVRLGRARRSDPDARCGGDGPRHVPRPHTRTALAPADERPPAEPSPVDATVRSTERPSLEPSVAPPLSDQRARAVPPPPLFGNGCSRRSLPARNIR